MFQNDDQIIKTSDTAPITAGIQSHTPVTMDVASELAQLRDLLTAQSKMLQQQSEEINLLKTQLTLKPSATSYTPGKLLESETVPANEPHSNSTSRRKVLKRLGFGAAGLAAGVTAIANTPNSAQAANGDYLLLGNSNFITNQTYLSQTSNATPQTLLWSDWNTTGQSTQPALATAGQGIGLAGTSSNGIGGYFAGSLAPIVLAPSTITGAPTTGTHQIGELFTDTSGALYYCVTAGTPGIWRKVASNTSAGAFHVLATPKRMIDTRSGALASNNIATVVASNPAGVTTSVTFAATESRTYSFNVANTGVPLGATAFSAVISAVNIVMSTGQSGYFQFWTGALTTLPGVSQVTYNVPNVTNGGSFISPLTTTDQFNIYSHRATDIIVDITGYYL